MLGSTHRHVLTLILQALKEFSEPWVVTGSCGMVLQGMPLEVHDIDLQTTEKGVILMEQILGGQPLLRIGYKSSEKIRSFFGALELENIKIEIMGDLQKLLPNGCWEEPPDISALRIRVPFEQSFVPVFPLEYELEAYRLMGRHQRADQIQAFLNRKSR